MSSYFITYFIITSLFGFGTFGFILWAYLDNVNYLLPFGFVCFSIATILLGREFYYGLKEVEQQV